MSTSPSRCLLRGYGPEILRMLMALHRSEQEASDVFASFAEGVWKACASDSSW